MITFESLQERSTRHYRTVHIENKEGLKDPSCAICYPPKGTSEEFDKFWDWYTTKVPATTYSEFTLKVFKDLLRLEVTEKNLVRDTKLLQLIGSIKYSRKPELSIKDISIRIIEIFVCSKYFELSIEQAERNLEKVNKGSPESSSEEKENTSEKESPEQTETEQEELFDTGIEYEIERTLESLENINTKLEDYSKEDSDSKESEESTNLINTEGLELETESETESEASGYNLDLLFEQNLENMADAGVQAALENVLGIGGINLKANIMNYPIFDGEEEDPREWLLKFNHAAAVNELPDNQKMRIAKGCLKGTALEWYNEDQTNIVQWHIDNNNDNFDDRLVDYFTPPQKREKWNMEIANIKQKDQETVKEYTKRFKILVRRIRNVPDELQRTYFRNGLLPLIKLDVIKGRPADLNTAIEIAEASELGIQVTYGISNERNEQTKNDQVKRNTFMREKDVKRNEMDDLIESFNKMALKVANIERGRTNRNGNNNNGRGCFNCGKMGHFAKDCRMQGNFGQNTRNNTCNECGRTGHIARECYKNRICQRCNKKGHTQEVCRNTISRLNYTEEWDNDDEFYDNYDEEEAYVTLRSGKKTHVPEFARRLQGQGHQKPKPVIIQGGQVIEEPKQNQPRKVVGRKKMNVDEEGEYEIKRTRGRA